MNRALIIAFIIALIPGWTIGLGVYHLTSASCGTFHIEKSTRFNNGTFSVVYNNRTYWGFTSDVAPPIANVLPVSGWHCKGFP